MQTIAPTHHHHAPSHVTFTAVSSFFNMDSGTEDTAELEEKLEDKVSLMMKRNAERLEIEKWLGVARKRLLETLRAGEEMLFVDS